MTLNSELSLLIPDWPLPDNVNAVSTTRAGGVSQSPYGSLNLAEHVGDNQVNVAANRARLYQQLGLTHPPYWLNQVHGNRLACIPGDADLEADASFTQQTQIPCVVMTADCLPVLFTNMAGTEVAAAHAGWRGLANGVLERTVGQFSSEPCNMMAWFGPAISQAFFEVGDDVKQAFVDVNADSAKAFRPGDKGKWFADLYQLARMRLQNIGLTQIYGGEYCTYREDALFYSYRREGLTGRMATLIWLDK